MATIFPVSASIGDQYQNPSNGAIYVWNGQNWTILGQNLQNIATTGSNVFNGNEAVNGNLDVVSGSITVNGNLLEFFPGPNIVITSGSLGYAISSSGGGASVTVSDVSPSTPAQGDLWWDTTVGNLYTYYEYVSASISGAAWVPASSLVAQATSANSASYAATASYVALAQSSSFALTASYISGAVLLTTPSGVQITGSLVVSGSNTFVNEGPAKFTGSVDITGSLSLNGVALGGSSGGGFPFTGSAIITGSLGVTGSVTITGSLNQGVTRLNIAHPTSASHAEGYQTTAIGEFSHAEGELNITTNGARGAHAEGGGTRAVNFYAHSEGQSTLASGSSSHTEGANTTTIGGSSHAEGYFSQTRITAFASHAEGLQTVTIGPQSHAEGDTTTAFGTGSHSEGRLSVSVGNWSHTQGERTRTDGLASFASGRHSLTSASADYSTAIGFGVTSSAPYQTVVGQYNNPANLTSNDLFVVGTGLSPVGRGNTLIVTRNPSQIYGSVTVSGSLQVFNGLPTDSVYTGIPVMQSSLIVPVGQRVSLGDMQFRIPSIGNKSLQVLASFSANQYSASYATSYNNGSLVGTRASIAVQSNGSGLWTYLNSSWNFTTAGDLQEATITQTTTGSIGQSSWFVRAQATNTGGTTWMIAIQKLA